MTDHATNKHLLLLAIFILTMTCGQVRAVFSAENKTPSQADPQQPAFSSVEERRLLLALRQERANLEQERKALEKRKKELKRLESEVDKKLDQLKSTRRAIEALLEEKDAVEQQRIVELSKMYAKMTPEKAAGILSRLDRKLAVAVLGKMKTKAAAKILDNLDREKAAELSQAFSSLDPQE